MNFNSERVSISIDQSEFTIKEKITGLLKHTPRYTMQVALKDGRKLTLMKREDGYSVSWEGAVQETGDRFKALCLLNNVLSASDVLKEVKEEWHPQACQFFANLSTDPKQEEEGATHLTTKDKVREIIRRTS